MHCFAQQSQLTVLLDCFVLRAEKLLFTISNPSRFTYRMRYRHMVCTYTVTFQLPDLAREGMMCVAHAVQD